MNTVPIPMLRSPGMKSVPLLLAFFVADQSLAQFQNLPAFSDWEPDVILLDAPSLDGFGGGCPIESADGLTLFTARTDESGSLNLWSNRRETIDAPFEVGAALPEPVNLAAGADFCPTPLPDGGLLFVSSRPGGCGQSVDLYFAEWDPVLGWQEPESLDCEPLGPNTPGTEFSPALVSSWRGVSLFYSSNFAVGDQELMESRLGAGGFQSGRRLPLVNSPFDDRQPNLTRDGLEIVFASDRHDPGSGNFDIYYARRPSIDQPFRNAVNLSETIPLSTAAQSETRPSISRDGRRLVYGAAGVLYQSERQELEETCFRFALQPTCDGD